MSAGRDERDAVRAAASGDAAFELERFAWVTPDRLELAGRFVGLAEPLPSEAVLIVRGSGREQRLPAVTDGLSGPAPADGRWRAAFAWLEAPSAFDAAELELDGAAVVALPGPRARRLPFRRDVLAVRPRDTPAADPRRAEVAAAPARAGERESVQAVPAAAGSAEAGSVAETASSVTGAEHMRLRADLLAAREEAHTLHGALQRATEQLSRAQEDLESTREEHAQDIDRFREGLASVRQVTEAAIAMERAASEESLGEQRTAAGNLAVEAENARSRLKQESEARARAEAEAAALRERLDALAPTLEHVGAARTDTERLLRRLETIHDALGDGR